MVDFALAHPQWQNIYISANGGFELQDENPPIYDDVVNDCCSPETRRLLNQKILDDIKTFSGLLGATSTVGVFRNKNVIVFGLKVNTVVRILRTTKTSPAYIYVTNGASPDSVRVLQSSQPIVSLGNNWYYTQRRIGV